MTSVAVTMGAKLSQLRYVKIQRIVLNLPECAPPSIFAMADVCTVYLWKVPRSPADVLQPNKLADSLLEHLEQVCRQAGPSLRCAASCRRKGIWSAPRYFSIELARGTERISASTSCCQHSNASQQRAPTTA